MNIFPFRSTIVFTYIAIFDDNVMIGHLPIVVIIMKCWIHIEIGAIGNGYLLLLLLLLVVLRLLLMLMLLLLLLRLLLMLVLMIAMRRLNGRGRRMRSIRLL